MNIDANPLSREVYHLIGEIEKLPASTQQTEVSIRASALLEKLCNLPAHAGTVPDSNTAQGFPSCRVGSWTRLVLGAKRGRKLSVEYKGKGLFVAGLEFTELNESMTAGGDSIEAALNALEEALVEDAADEMTTMSGCASPVGKKHNAKLCERGEGA